MTFYVYTDTAGTTVAAPGDAVARMDDLSGNGNHATQVTASKRPILSGTIPYRLNPDFVDDTMSMTLPGSFIGGRAFSMRHGHQIDISVPLAGFDQDLPIIQIEEWIAREGAFSLTEVSALESYLPGNRRYMVCQTNDLTLTGLRMYMINSETPVVTAIGDNDVVATLSLGGDSDSAFDLAAAGLTAPATVLFPMVVDNNALYNFYAPNNSLTGSIPDFSANVNILRFQCNDNNLTGSIPNLSANVNLLRCRFYDNNLTGSIPDLSANVNLQHFQCFNNNLTGSIPNLSANVNLLKFQCYNNSLTGSIPDLSANVALQYFQCHNNSLTGSIPNLSANVNLLSFQCYTNSLTGSIPDLSANVALQTFQCYTNNLTGWDGGTIAGSLVSFDASDNALPQASVDGILQAFDASGSSSGTCTLSGGTNAIPSATGNTAIDNLRARGWTVTVSGGY